MLAARPGNLKTSQALGWRQMQRKKPEGFLPSLFEIFYGIAYSLPTLFPSPDYATTFLSSFPSPGASGLAPYQAVYLSCSP